MVDLKISENFLGIERQLGRINKTSKMYLDSGKCKFIRIEACMLSNI